MTGLLRTSLFFFLPIFIILAIYQTRVSNQLSPEEQKQVFREQNESTLNLIRSEAEELLAEGKTGRIPMPEKLTAKDVVLAEVNDGTGPVLSFLSPSLIESNTWSFAPDPEAGDSYSANYQFLIRPAEKEDSFRVVLFQETAYRKDGNPVRLDVYLKRESLAGDE